MVVKTVSVAPEYVSFYISGSEDFEVPVDRLLLGVTATPQCIVVTCTYYNEGNTSITLGPSHELPPQDMPMRFDSVLETPEHRVLLSDVHMPEILSMDVPGSRTRIRIWADHETMPDNVVIALG